MLHSIVDLSHALIATSPESRNVAVGGLRCFSLGLWFDEHTRCGISLSHERPHFSLCVEILTETHIGDQRWLQITDCWTIIRRSLVEVNPDQRHGTTVEASTRHSDAGTALYSKIAIVAALLTKS